MPYKDPIKQKEFEKEYSQRPEVKERKREYYHNNKEEILKKQKKYNQRPEVKQRHNKLLKKRRQRPEVREKMFDNICIDCGKKIRNASTRCNNCYNKIRFGKGNPFYGKTHTEESRRQISKTNSNPSEETRKKMSKTRIINELSKGENNPMYGRCGEKSPKWLGGKSFEPYGLDFNNKFKELIRERDNYCCVVCNKMQEELDRKLDVHHIDYCKTNNLPQNCVSLCRQHHADTNGNREAWKSFFQSLLKEREGYEYTEEGKIILDLTNKGGVL